MKTLAKKKNSGFIPLHKNLCEGFTLIEILVVIGIIAVLAGIVLVAINPARQFKQARDTQRTSNVSAILDAIGQNIADNKGIFTCSSGAIPATSTVMAKSGFNIRPCLVPDYMTELPYDPGTSAGVTGSNDCDATCSGATTYDTKYNVVQDSVTGRITVNAPLGELVTSSTPISITR